VGNKCAIGHCIPNIGDCSADPWFIWHVKYIPEETLDTSATSQEIYGLQMCHDLGELPEQMKQNFNAFALKFKLTLPGQNV
jgi:hypothetical protein